jgi:hypothetical protein
VTVQAGSLLEGVIFASVGTLIVVACIAAVRSHRYMRRIADNALRYRRRSSTNVDPEKLVPIVKVVFGLATAIGTFIAIVGLMALLTDLR